jgi:iron(II)-dependent oxidoreductase
VTLLRADPQRWWDVALQVAEMTIRGTSSAAWNLIETLCADDPPSESDSLQAIEPWTPLMAGAILHKGHEWILDSMPMEYAPVLERVRQWLHAIVTQGWLQPVDRDRAGQMMAVLGDPRDLDALVTIPAGSFVMGSDDGGNASPKHVLTLPRFRIGKYPVVNAQYERFVKAAGREWLSKDRYRPERSNAPAALLTWFDARAYCAWLTQEWRAKGVISANEVVRLPTEAEWEKACRGSINLDDTNGDPARLYPWGNEWNEDRCNSNELGLDDTCVVGMFPQGASPYGCLDMGGQVWEWTLSLWGKNMHAPQFRYPYDSEDGREDPKADADVRRVLRGGSFGGTYDRAGCAFRGGLEPTGFWRGDGFRIVVAKRNTGSGVSVQ